MKNGFVKLPVNELENINGGFIIIDSMLVGAGVGLISAGFAAGSWLKHKIWG